MQRSENLENEGTHTIAKSKKVDLDVINSHKFWIMEMLEQLNQSMILVNQQPQKISKYKKNIQKVNSDKKLKDQNIQRINSILKIIKDAYTKDLEYVKDSLKIIERDYLQNINNDQDKKFVELLNLLSGVYAKMPNISEIQKIKSLSILKQDVETAPVMNDLRDQSIEYDFGDVLTLSGTREIPVELIEKGTKGAFIRIKVLDDIKSHYKGSIHYKIATAPESLSGIEDFLKESVPDEDKAIKIIEKILKLASDSKEYYKSIDLSEKSSSVIESIVSKSNRQTATLQEIKHIQQNNDGNVNEHIEKYNNGAVDVYHLIDWLRFYEYITDQEKTSKEFAKQIKKITWIPTLSISTFNESPLSIFINDQDAFNKMILTWKDREYYVKSNKKPSLREKFSEIADKEEKNDNQVENNLNEGQLNNEPIPRQHQENIANQASNLNDQRFNDEDDLELAVINVNNNHVLLADRHRSNCGERTIQCLSKAGNALWRLITCAREDQVDQVGNNRDDRENLLNEDVGNAQIEVNGDGNNGLKIQDTLFNLMALPTLPYRKKSFISRDVTNIYSSLSNLKSDIGSLQSNTKLLIIDPMKKGRSSHQKELDLIQMDYGNQVTIMNAAMQQGSNECMDCTLILAHDIAESLNSNSSKYTHVWANNNIRISISYIANAENQYHALLAIKCNTSDIGNLASLVSEMTDNYHVNYKRQEVLSPSNQINNGIAKLGEYKQNDALSALTLQDMMRSSSKHNKNQDTKVDTDKLSDKNNLLDSPEELNNDTHTSTSNDILYNPHLTEKEKKSTV